MRDVMMAAIAYPKIDPVLLHIWGPISIRWYGLAYAAGILLGWMLLHRLCRRPGAPMAARHIDDFMLWATVGIVAGGRLGYVLFYNPRAYLAEPAAILRLWDGGMSFHGGALGMFLAIVLFARANRLDWLRIHDHVAVVVPIGLFFGRLANFINAELWGRVSTLPWAMVFPDAGPLPRHPSQLYEALLEGLVLLAIQLTLFHRTDAARRPGLLVGSFLFFYGLFRFMIEWAREPDEQLGTLSWGLTMGQTLCLPMLLGGLYLMARARRRPVVA